MRSCGAVALYIGQNRHRKLRQRPAPQTDDSTADSLAPSACYSQLGSWGPQLPDSRRHPWLLVSRDRREGQTGSPSSLWALPSPPPSPATLPPAPPCSPHPPPRPSHNRNALTA